MSKELVRQLKSIGHESVKPNAEWLSKNRALLLSQIKNSVGATERRQTPLENIWSWMSIFLPREIVYNVVRPMAVLLIVALVGTSGWITGVDAAYEAIPGDGVAYYVKRGIEKTQVAVVNLVGNQDAQTKMHLKLASSRANEVKKMLVRTNIPDLQKRTAVSATVAELKQEINNVNKNLDEANSELVQAVVKDTKQIKTVLEDAKSVLPASSTVELAKEVKEVKDLAKDVSVKALEVLVNQHVAGDQTFTSEEVLKVVSSTLQAIVEEVSVSQATAEEVKTVVEGAKGDLVRSLSSSASSTEIAEKIAASVAQSALVAETAKQVNDDVKTQATAATTALSAGDLVSAVGTIKDVTQVTKTVEQMTDSAILQATEVMPIAQMIKDSAIANAESLSTTSTFSADAVAIPTTTANTTTVKTTTSSN